MKKPMFVTVAMFLKKNEELNIQIIIYDIIFRL